MSDRAPKPISDYYWVEFNQVDTHIPIVVGKLASGIYSACNVSRNELKDFEPQINFISFGPNFAAMHTNLDPANYPETHIGMHVFSYNEPARVYLRHGAGAGVCFNPCVVGAGIENETKDPTGETRQKLRHCGTGFADIRKVLENAWDGKTLTVNFGNNALPESVRPDTVINYKVNSNITPQIAETLLKDVFFCLEYEKSAAAMKYQQDIASDETPNAFTKWYI